MESVKQRKANIVRSHLHVESKTPNKTEIIDTENKLVIGRCERGVAGMGEGVLTKLLKRVKGADTNFQL